MGYDILRQTAALFRTTLLRHLAVVLLGVGLIFGVFFSYRSSQSYQVSSYLSVVGRNLDQAVYFESNREILSAIEDGLKSRDKYFHFYYTDDEFDASMSSLTASMSRKYGILFVTKTGEISDVLRHSPNFGQLRKGDRILSLNSQTDPETFYDLLQTTSTATAQIQRDDQLLVLPLRSAELHPAYAEVSGSTATVTIYFFRPEILPALRDFFAELPPTITTLRFDVSQCPGGRVKTLSSLLSLLFPEKTPFFVEVRKTSKLLYASNRRPVFDLTTYTGTIEVLKSSRTASCAEIFIGVLQYYLHERLKLAGEMTYGKWTTVQPTKFLKGGMLLSIGKVHLPDGSTYEGTGL